MKKLLKVIMSMFKEEKLQEFQDIEIKDVVMDSKKVQEGSLFLAINNGNKYIQEALNKGAAIVIGDKVPEEINDKRVITVENTIEIMQKLAREYRRELAVEVIGITGSNGKTTTKDLITGVLSEKYITEKTQGNYNNHIGLPYTILTLPENTEVVVLEMGMSSFGEIDTLCKIAEPNYGIITNIGDSHLEFLKTRENVFKAKGEMIKYISSDKLFIFGDDPYLKNVSGIKVGYLEENDYKINIISEELSATEFTVNNFEKYKISLNGKHNCINATMAIGIGKTFGLTMEEIQRGLEKSQMTAMRFEKKLVGETLYINDAYNASPTSMEYSLMTFDNLKVSRKKIAILGDMLELGEESVKFHKEILEKAIETKIDKIFLYGPLMAQGAQLVKNNNIYTFETKNDIVKALKEEKEPIAVLLKGSRGMKLEEIIEQKEQK
ncbi:MAG: UDP-N-acetylmuramoyl-tripeptide--D-alanyl-D-alanine ligase [Cetobacterium sp.]|uniref:UDP-N-acetylmuramoyl-tripeptide--D-alanyl-D- alanine ligase n=1 Tax=Cetobacterium sp. TaxID=2071632 RepID=UPI003F3F8275